MVEAHEHDWRWLPRPVVVIGGLGEANRHYNIICHTCGKRGWGHGKAPNAPVVDAPRQPTAGRS